MQKFTKILSLFMAAFLFVSSSAISSAKAADFSESNCMRTLTYDGISYDIEKQTDLKTGAISVTVTDSNGNVTIARQDKKTLTLDVYDSKIKKHSTKQFSVIKENNNVIGQDYIGGNASQGFHYGIYSGTPYRLWTCETDTSGMKYVYENSSKSSSLYGFKSAVDTIAIKYTEFNTMLAAAGASVAVGALTGLAIGAIIGAILAGGATWDAVNAYLAMDSAKSDARLYYNML